MATKNLWGNLPWVSDLVTPTTILKQQATLLAQATKGILSAYVHFDNTASQFSLELRIVASAIENYEYSVLHASHRVELYPVTVVASWDRHRLNAQRECENQEQFEAAIAEILSSQT